jgi:hypothetical protein
MPKENLSVSLPEKMRSLVERGAKRVDGGARRICFTRSPTQRYKRRKPLLAHVLGRGLINAQP